MSLIKAYDDSESAGSTSNQGKATGPDNPAALGYIEMSSSNEPAKTNAEVTTTKNFGANVSGGQDGTSIDAYNHQGPLGNAESGDTNG